MRQKSEVKLEEDGWSAVQAARHHQLRKEVSRRLARPGAIADVVRAEVVHLGFSPQEVYAEILRQS